MEKPRLMERGRVCSKKNLNDEGLGQNKMLCSFLRVKLEIVKQPLQAPQYSLY